MRKRTRSGAAARVRDGAEERRLEGAMRGWRGGGVHSPKGSTLRPTGAEGGRPGPSIMRGGDGAPPLTGEGPNESPAQTSHSVHHDYTTITPPLHHHYTSPTDYKQQRPPRDGGECPSATGTVNARRGRGWIGVFHNFSHVPESLHSAFQPGSAFYTNMLSSA